MYSSSRDKSITVEYQDVVPSTDLPPYMKGKMHCYLHVVVGKLAWKRCDCNDYKLPLPSATYIRLRWWGDTSQGTYFRPQIEKYSRIIKCRSQFCVRSRPQQIAAYFKDMGSATFDILQSPNSIPLARALVPAVVSLSFNCSVRGAFPVRTPSARTIGELQVAMSFKPRRCDCDEINLEALGTCKTISYRACPPRLKCFVRKQKELREGRVPVTHAFFSPNSKGSSCYTKLSATGRYGKRSCICEDEKACLDRIADCNEGASCSDDMGKCCVAASQMQQNNCQLYEAPRECVYNEEPPDSCQVRVLNGLIEQTKQLNKNLVTALNCQNEEKCPLRPVECCRGYARVSIHALQLHKPLEQLMSYPDPSCPLASNAPQDMRQMYVVQYIFPSQLVWSCYDSTINQVKSVNTWPGGCVRFDQTSVVEVVFSPDTLNNWMSEILKFTVLRKDVNCSEATVIGVAELPLRCIAEDPDFSFSGCIPVTTCGPRRFQCTQTHGTLEVSIKLSHGNKPFPVCAFALEPPPQPFPCTVVTSQSEGRKNKNCQYTRKCAKKAKNTSNCYNMIAKPCVAKTNKTKSTSQFFTPTCLFFYVFLDRAEEIPAARIDVDDCSKCFPPNIYLICRNFSTDNEDVSITTTVWNNHNPSFRYSELIPIKVDDQFLEVLQYKSIVVEVWTKMPDSCPGSDKLMGLVRLPLTYFYDVLKDHDVTKVLSEKESPLVPVNDFLPIVDVFSNEERGQLKLVFALGTSDQINSLRKSIEDSESDEADRSESKISEDVLTSSDEGSSTEHTLRVTVHGMQGFTPCATQVCGRTNCYIEYIFPSQKCCEDIKDNDCMAGSTVMKHFKTRTKPCVRNPHWEFKTTHKYILPSGVPLQNLFSNFDSCSGKELSFNLWTSQYCARQSDKLIAKGSLLVEKLCPLLSCTRKKYTKETYQIPLKFVKPCNKMAGDLFISIKHSTKPSEAFDNVSSTRCCQDVQIRFALIQAGGLKAGVKMATGSDVEGGVTTYATIKTTFLPQPQSYITRSVPNSYSPNYNHCVEIHCPVIYCGDTPTPLISLLDTGSIEVQIWQGSSSESSLQQGKEQTDILLGEAKIPTQLLLFKTKGFNSWCSLLSKCDKSKAAGAIQVSLTFSSGNALDSVLEGACEMNWCPTPGTHLEALFDLRCGLRPIEKFETNEEYATFRVGITNLLIPKKWLSNENNDVKINKNSVFLRYKFHDFDTYVSRRFLVNRKKKEKKEETLLNIKLAYQKAFLCKPTPCLFWYLKEEMFEIQIWHSKNRSKKIRKRPNDSDTLLGSLCIDLSPLLDGRLQTAQHICSILPLFKAEMDDLGDSSAQVCLHLVPGNDIKPYETNDSDQDESSLLHDSFGYGGDDDDDDDDDDLDKDYGRETDDKNAYKSDKSNCFTAIVSVEKAMHLTSRPSAADIERKNVGVNFYVSYPMSCDGKEEKTKHAVAAPSPVWNDSREIQLDRKILEKNGGKVVFQICQNGECAQKSAEANNQVVGYATVDISALTNGFRAVTGWYNVLDRYGKCQGEIKIGVTPTDPSELAKCSGSSWLPCHRMIHAMPIMCPVVGPMGTVYIPGISGFADTVASTFLKEQELSKQEGRCKDCKEYTSSTHPSSNLYRLHKTTLQRNMTELDQIRGNLKQNKLVDNAETGSVYSVPVATPTPLLPSSSPFQTPFSAFHHHPGAESMLLSSVAGSSIYQPRFNLPQHNLATDVGALPDSPQPPSTLSSIKPVMPSSSPQPTNHTESLSSKSSSSQTVASPTPSGQPVEAATPVTTSTATLEPNNITTFTSELAKTAVPTSESHIPLTSFESTDAVSPTFDSTKTVLSKSESSGAVSPNFDSSKTALSKSELSGAVSPTFDSTKTALSKSELSGAVSPTFDSTKTALSKSELSGAVSPTFDSTKTALSKSELSGAVSPTFDSTKTALSKSELSGAVSPVSDPTKDVTYDSDLTKGISFASDPTKNATPISDQAEDVTPTSEPIKTTPITSQTVNDDTIASRTPKESLSASGITKNIKSAFHPSKPTASQTSLPSTSIAPTSQLKDKAVSPPQQLQYFSPTTQPLQTTLLFARPVSPSAPASKSLTQFKKPAARLIKSTQSKSKASARPVSPSTPASESPTQIKKSASRLIKSTQSKPKTQSPKIPMTKTSAPTFGSKTRAASSRTVKMSSSSNRNFKTAKPASQSSLSSRPTYQKIQADRLAAKSITSTPTFKPIRAAAATLTSSTTKTTSTPTLQPITTSETSPVSSSQTHSNVPTTGIQPVTSETLSPATSPLSVIQSESISQTPSENQDETTSTTTSGSKNTLIPSGCSNFKKFRFSNCSQKSRQESLTSCTLSVNRTKIHKADIYSVYDFAVPEMQDTGTNSVWRD